MKEGTVGKWYKKEGDAVEKDEPIVEVISEKATYDLEAPASGVLRKVLVDAGANAPVDGVLAVIVAEGEEYSEALVETGVLEQSVEGEGRVLSSPAAKRLAREHGVDLGLVRGSGSDGRISEEDVERFLGEQGGLVPKVKETITLSGFRKTSAERLASSFRTAPHSTVVMEVDVTNAVFLRERLGVSYSAFLVKVVAEALVEHPMVNSSLDGDKIRLFESVNVGVAVATENGLVVPVIHDADRKSFAEIDALLRELTDKAKLGKLSREDVSGGTFTVTNLGMYGVDWFSPIINPPEAAILGVGRIVEKPVAVDGKVMVKPVMMLSLSYDHRIVDGAPAAQFLQTVQKRIERLTD